MDGKEIDESIIDCPTGLHLELVHLLPVRLELLVLFDGGKKLIQIRDVPAGELFCDRPRDVIRADLMLLLSQLGGEFRVEVDVQRTSVVIQQHVQVLVAEYLLRVPEDLMRHLRPKNEFRILHIVLFPDCKVVLL